MKSGRLHGPVPDRSQATQYDRVLTVTVERERARFGASFKCSPRPPGRIPRESATFAEATGLLAYVAAMGFDVLYLPPVHPIGRSFRKGPNNALDAAPTIREPVGDWIGTGRPHRHRTGPGHARGLRRVCRGRRRAGLEIALDIAFQASPDHPYVREHPDWFRRRPDGSIKYRENPPKKYQDIYPLNFESADWRALWQELTRVFEFWIQHGVKIFRVDNPHTKPFRFWAWVLTELTRDHPDTIFLAEAFTRPKIMNPGEGRLLTVLLVPHLAKREGRDHRVLTELTETPIREYLTNLFANTPDILHAYLQRGGRPAFQVRLVLAATLTIARHLQRVRTRRERPTPERQRGISRLREVSNSRPRLSARQRPGRIHRTDQRDQASPSCASARLGTVVSSHRQRRDPRLQQALG